MSKEKIILIDVSGVAFPMALGVREKSDTEIIFNLLELVRMYGIEFNTTKFIFCFEGGSACRKSIYPEYKSNRNKNQKPEIKERIQKLYTVILNFRNIIENLGFLTVSFSGYEADDMIGGLVKNNPDANFVIIANDKDFMQLISCNVSLFLERKMQLVTEDIFRAKHQGLHPKDYAQVLAIAGDRADNVMGVPDVGESSAINYLVRNPKLSTRRKEAIQNSTEIIERNLKVVQLPFETTPALKINSDMFPKLIRKNFYDTFTQAGLLRYVYDGGYVDELWEKFLEVDNGI